MLYTIVTFKKFGIGVKFVDSSDPAEYVKVIDEKTKAIFVETIGNPKYNVSPIPGLAKVRIYLYTIDYLPTVCTKVAHDHGIPLVVDNTFGMGGKR
jgi:O-acetylhomoserine/O-acetylserine sulfhydrylase